MTPESGKNKTRAKLRITAYDPPGDGNCYIKVKLFVNNTDKYIKERLERTGEKLTYNTFALKMCDLVLSKVPELNNKIVFGKSVPMKKKRVMTLCDVGGDDLGLMIVDDCDKMSYTELHDYMNSKAKLIRKKEDKEHNERYDILKNLPDWALYLLVNLSSFISYNLNLDIPSLSIKKEAFGGVLLSNLTVFDISEAWGALPPMRNTLSLFLCKPYWEMHYDENGENGRMEKIINLCMSTDHRLADGSSLNKGIKFINDVWKNPAAYDIAKV